MWDWSYLLDLVGRGEWFTLIKEVYTTLVGDFFYLFLAALIFIPLYLKTRSVLVPSVVLIIFGTILLPLLPPETQRFIYLFLVFGIAGTIYSLISR